MRFFSFLPVGGFYLTSPKDRNAKIREKWTGICEIFHIALPKLLERKAY